MPTEPGPWRRRSERLSIAIPLYVSSLDPVGRFAEVCETISVNNHGCVIRFPKKVETGAEVRLDIPHTNRRTKARVVRVDPGDPSRNVWHIALELDSAENFWGLRFPPVDWVGGRDLTPTPTPLSPPSELPASNAPAHAADPNRNLLRNLQNALEEVRQTKVRLETLMEKANETLEGRITQVVSQRATQFESQLEQRWKEWSETQLRHTAEAKPTSLEIQSAVEQLHKQVPEVAAQIADGVAERLSTVWEESRRKLAAAVDTRLQEVRRTEQQLRTMADRLSTESQRSWPSEESLRTKILQLLGPQLDRARTQLDQEATQARARHLRELDEELHKKTVQSVEQWVKVATAVEQRSRQWAEKLPEQEARIQELQETIRTTGESLSQTVETESQHFAQLLRERLAEATGQLKGQTQFALEMAQSLAEEYRRRAETEIADALTHQLRGATEQVGTLQARLDSLRADAEQSFRTTCDALIKEAAAELDVSTRDLSLRYIRSLETRTSEILEAMADVVRQRLRQSGAGPDTAGRSEEN